MGKVPRQMKSQKSCFTGLSKKNCKERTTGFATCKSPLYLVESEHSCTIRFIQKMIDSVEINDNEFRHYVRTIIS